jgi:hypothetical protein
MAQVARDLGALAVHRPTFVGSDVMKTRLTDVLEVEHPVMLAGMGGVSYSKLVAAVSEAGASAPRRCNPTRWCGRWRR